MSQRQTIPIQQLEQLIIVAKQHNRPIEVDWVNRQIEVLSEVKTHPTKILSTGPMTYQDYLGQINGHYDTLETRTAGFR